MNDNAYFIFDCESVPDGRLLADVRYNGQLSPEEAIAKAQAENEEKTGSSFIAATFQIPISIGWAKARTDYSLVDVGAVQHRPEDDGPCRELSLARRFWLHAESPKGRYSTWVTFNGRCFDVPLLEIAALRFGIQAVQHFEHGKGGRRYRYDQLHIDLMDQVGNFGAFKIVGGLNLLAKIVGAPGKSGMSGADVLTYWNAGRTKEIDWYCIQDVLDTYRVFIRMRVVDGSISSSNERDLLAAARMIVERKAKEEQSPVLLNYLASLPD